MSSKERIRVARHTTPADIIDRVLDRGVLIDYHSRVSLGGIDALLTVDGQYVVTSTDTSLKYAAVLPTRRRAIDARPRFSGPAEPFVYAAVAPEQPSRRRAAIARNRRKR